MVNPANNQLYKFPTEINPEAHNEPKCTSTNENMAAFWQSFSRFNVEMIMIEEDQNNLKIRNEHYCTNNSNTTGHSKQPPRLRFIANPASSSCVMPPTESANITFSSNPLSHYNVFVNNTLNGTANTPKLIPIGASFDSSTAAIAGHVSHLNESTSSQNVASNSKSLSNTLPFVRSSSLNYSERKIPCSSQSFDNTANVTTHSDPTAVNHTTSSYAHQDSNGGYSNDFSSDLRNNYFKNTQSNSSHQQSSVVPNNFEIFEPAANTMINYQNNSQGCSVNSSLNDNGDYNANVSIVDSTLSGNSTIDCVNSTAPVTDANSNFYANNDISNNTGTSGMGIHNNSAAYGDDSLYPLATSNGMWVASNPCDFQTGAAHMARNNMYQLDQNEYLAFECFMKPNDPNSMLFDPLMVKKHFIDGAANATSEYVLCTSLNNIANVAIGATCVQQSNLSPFINSRQNYTSNQCSIPNEQFNNLANYNASRIDGSYIDSNGMAILPLDDASNYQPGKTCFNGSKRFSAVSSRKSSSSRRRNDMSDPQASHKRHNHNMLERKRRSELRSSFIRLVGLIPELKGTAPNRLSKVKILTSATNYIKAFNAAKASLVSLKTEREKVLNALTESLDRILSEENMNSKIILN